jgi:hypothetical protein
MTICGVMNEGDLPKIWRLLPQYGKRDRLAVELALKRTAQRVGLTYSAPMVTPEFAKRLMSLNFAGKDQDNLPGGVQPFALISVPSKPDIPRGDESRPQLSCQL